MSINDKTKEELIQELEQRTLEIRQARQRLLKIQCCHNQLSTILANSSLSGDEAIQQMVNAITDCWFDSELVMVNIIVYGEEFKTPNYIDSELSIQQPITLFDEVIGQIKISYKVRENAPSELKFQPDDDDILFTIAQRISNFIEQDAKNAELQASQAKFSNLMENINDVIYTTDEHANITYVSPSVKKLLGYTQEEIIGKNFTMFIGNKSEHLQHRFEEIQKSFSLQNEYQILSKSGDSHWIRFSSQAIIKESRFLGVTGILIDVSETKKIELELQKSESLHRSILNASPDTIFISDLNGVVLFTSHMANKMFDYEEGQFPLNQSLFSFLDPKDHEKARNAIGAMFEGYFSGATEYVGIKSDGSHLDLEVNGEFIRDGEGNPTSMVFVVRDISERKIAQKKLEKSEETYKSLVESINDVIFNVAMDGTIKYLSPAIKKLLTYQSENLIGQNFFTFVHPDDRSRLIELFKNNRFDEFDYQIYRLISAEGKILWVQVSAQYFYEEGEIVGRTGILRDITEQKLAEEKLSKSEEQHRRLVESVNDVIYEIDAVGVIKFVSPSVVKVLGYTIEEVMGRNIFEFVYAEDVLRIQNSLRNLDEKNYNYLEYRYKRKDGSIHWVRSSTSPIYENGIMMGGTGILTDITERKVTQEELIRSEERFSQIAEQSRNVIWEVDETGLFTYVNNLAQSIWGFTPEELIGIKYFFDLHPIGGREEFRQKTLVEFNRKAKFSNFINQIETKDNRLIWVSTNGIPVVDSQNNLIGYRGADTDITERLTSEKALRMREAELNEAQKIAQMCSWELNADTGHLSWSENYYRIMGIPLGTAMKTEFFLERVHPDDRMLVEKYFQEMVSTRKPVQYDIRILTADNKYNWVQNNIVPNFDGNKLINFKGVNVDITAKRLDEEKIRSQNEKLNAILTAIPDLIFVMNKEGIYLEAFASDPAKLLVPLESVIGINIRDVFEKEVAAHFIDRITESLDNKVLTSINYTVSLSDSPSTHFEARIAPLDEDKVLILSRDVTEQAQNELEIKKLSLVVKQSPVITIITDLKGQIEYVNPVFETITGFKAEEVIGTNSNIFHVGKEDQKQYDQIWKTLQNGKEWHGEWVRQKKNGEQYWEDVAISTIQDSEGKTINYLAVKQDITHRKQTEKILKQSEESYRHMFGNNPQPMWIYDLETLAFLEVNDAAIRHYGYSREDFLSMTLKDIRPAEDLEALMKDIEISRRSYNATGEWRHLKKNGELINVEISSHPITFNSRKARHILVKDITERKKVEKEILDLNANLEQKIEERTTQLNKLNANLVKEIEFRKRTEAALSESEKSYRMVVENVNEIFYKTDTEGKWLFLNKSWEVVTGFKVSETLGKPFHEYLYPEDLAIIVSLFNQLIKGEKDFARQEVRYLTKTNDIRWIEVYGRPGLDEDGSISGTYGTLQDITERKKSNEIILKARLEAEHANLAKSEFLSRMSHELRTPMNSILGFAQLLEMGVLTPKQRKSIDHILNSGRHLLQLINEVLDISRIEAGYLSIRPEQVNVNKINQEIIDIVTPIASERQISLQISYSLQETYLVNSDNQRLKQVLLNLINNAIKYNRIGGSVMIHTEQHYSEETGAELVRISIIDTGIGIAAEDIPHIFTPFERIGAERSGIEGTGLGLAVVSKIMKALGGNVGVESTPDIGSKFWIELPRISEDKGSNEFNPEKKSNPDTNLKGKILYIEDNSSNFELVDQFLSIRRPEIQLITNIYGKMAVPLAIKYSPDLILIDLNLPDIDGRKILDLLREEPLTKSIPVVVVSADAMPERYDLLTQAGAKHYLTKPYNLQELLEIIDQFLPGTNEKLHS